MKVTPWTEGTHTSGQNARISLQLIILWMIPSFFNHNSTKMPQRLTWPDTGATVTACQHLVTTARTSETVDSVKHIKCKSTRGDILKYANHTWLVLIVSTCFMIYTRPNLTSDTVRGRWQNLRMGGDNNDNLRRFNQGAAGVDLRHGDIVAVSHHSQATGYTGPLPSVISNQPKTLKLLILPKHYKMTFTANIAINLCHQHLKCYPRQYKQSTAFSCV